MRAAVILLSTFVLAACNMAADAQRGDAAPSSGQGGQRSYQVGAFDSVSLGGHHNVVVRVGPAVSVRAEGASDDLDRLEIRIDGSDLRIGTKKGDWKVGRNSDPVTVFVTLPALAAASIGGSGDMRIDAVAGGDFSASIGGSGDMTIDKLTADKASFAIAGSGTIRAAGTAGTTDISVAGSGDVDLGGLESRAASVSIVGSGDVRARAMDTASVSIMGSGDVAMSGTAKCSINKMGSGDVRCES